jgi:hypothetical protein
MDLIFYAGGAVFLVLFFAVVHPLVAICVILIALHQAAERKRNEDGD